MLRLFRTCPLTDTCQNRSTPVRFSSGLVDTLASSPSDSTREAQLELHIQSRVASELALLSERESAVLAGLDSAPASTEGGGEGGADGLDRHRVLGEIERLRVRLESAPRLHALDDSVAAAREAVRSCLVAQYASCSLFSLSSLSLPSSLPSLFSLYLFPPFFLRRG